jgi:hypothetical protein
MIRQAFSATAGWREKIKCICTKEFTNFFSSAELNWNLPSLVYSWVRVWCVTASVTTCREKIARTKNVERCLGNREGRLREAASPTNYARVSGQIDRKVKRVRVQSIIQQQAVVAGRSPAPLVAVGAGDFTLLLQELFLRLITRV